MPKVRTLTPAASPAHHFGSEVRRARKEAGMTLAELAALVPCDESTVSRIEAGLLTPDLHFAETCDTAFRDRHGWFARFWNDSRNWDGNPALAPAFRDFAEDELRASSLYMFEHSLLPGLLQTEDYARTVLATYPKVTAAQVAERTTGRLRRQDILTGDAPPWLWAVIDQGALHHDVGGAKIMRGALLHLAEMASLPNVSVQILPPGVHVGAQGAFAIAETDGTGGSAFIEDATDGHTTDDPEVVRMLSVRFRWLQTLAMAPDASLNMIERASDDHDVAQVELQRCVGQQLRGGRGRQHRAGPRHRRPRRIHAKRPGVRMAGVHGRTTGELNSGTLSMKARHVCRAFTFSAPVRRAPAPKWARR